MNRDLHAYLLTMDRWLDADTCREVMADITASPWQPHHYDGDTEDMVRPPEQRLNVTLGREGRAAALLAPHIRRAFEFYTVSRRMPWFGVPPSQSPAQFHRYKPGNTMVEHCDHLTSLFEGKDHGIPILTFLAVLNDEFSGGELVLWGDTPVPMRAGTIVVFPSNFLFPHRIDPVIDGLRYSAVSWAW